MEYMGGEGRGKGIAMLLCEEWYTAMVGFESVNVNIMWLGETLY